MKIYLAGHRGMVGAAILRQLEGRIKGGEELERLGEAPLQGLAGAHRDNGWVQGDLRMLAGTEPCGPRRQYLECPG